MFIYTWRKNDRLTIELKYVQKNAFPTIYKFRSGIESQKYIYYKPPTYSNVLRILECSIEKSNNL